MSLIDYTYKELTVEISRRDKIIDKHIIDSVFKVVCNYYDISKKDVISQKRKEEIVEAREVVCYIFRNTTFFTFNKIGLIMNKNHSSVLSSSRQAKKYYDKGGIYKTIIDELIRSCKFEFSKV